MAGLTAQHRTRHARTSISPSPTHSLTLSLPFFHGMSTQEQGFTIGTTGSEQQYCKGGILAINTNVNHKFTTCTIYIRDMAWVLYSQSIIQTHLEKAIDRLRKFARTSNQHFLKQTFLSMFKATARYQICLHVPCGLGLFGFWGP